jgi:ABC-type transport system substrate-binding protein
MLAPASDALVAQARQDARLRVVSRPTSFIHYLAFGFHSHAAPPLRDRRVRRAVRLALDLPALIRSASPGGGAPASQLAPPGTIGYDRSLQAPARDLARARALLAEAGHAQGVDLELDVRSKDQVLARAVAAQVAEAGIRVRPRVLPVEEFARRIDGTSPFYLYNWIVGQETGAALRNFFHTRDRARTLGLQNRIGYSNPRLDALLERSSEPVSPAERVALQQQAMALLMDDLPWVPLFIPHERTIQPADLEIPTRLDEMLLLADVRPSTGE